MPTTTPLTDAINALTTYSNTVTGASDQTLSDAVATLAAGYGGEDILQQFQDGTYDCGIPYVTGTVGWGFTNYTLNKTIFPCVLLQDLTVDPDTDEHVTYYIRQEDAFGNANSAISTQCNGYVFLFNGSPGSNYQNFNIVNGTSTRLGTYNGSTGIRLGIPIYGIEQSYMYVQETGRILFAGKDTIYYGKSNIND